MKNLTTLYIATALSAMLSACGDSTPPDITSVQAYVTGHVTDPAGAPVAGAAVRIQATQPSTGDVLTEESTWNGAGLAASGRHPGHSDSTGGRWAGAEDNYGPIRSV